MPNVHRRKSARSPRREFEALERREVLSSAAIAPQVMASAVATRQVVYASPSAMKSVKSTLSGSPFAIRPLASMGARSTGAVVVSNADLARARMVKMLKSAYANGRTVALAGATATSTDELRNDLAYAASAQWSADTASVSLVAFRKVQADGRTQFSMDILPPGSGAGAAGSIAASTSPLTAAWLNRVLSATPTIVAPPSGLSQSNLLDIATSYESSSLNYDSTGQVQIVNTVWDARSFQSQQDYYYDLQEVDYNTYYPTGPFVTPWTMGASNLPVMTPHVTTIQPSPQSTQQTTTVTSGTSYTIGASVGFNEAQGFNVSVSASTTISNSKTVQVPPIQIQYTGNLATSETDWSYTPSNPQPAGTTLTYYNQWIWGVPFSSYQSGQTQFQFTSIATEAVVPTLEAYYVPSVPLPFGTVFSIQPPVVTGVSRSKVRVGDTFTITGTGLYPSLITGVLIGGQSLSASQYSTVSDTKITVVAPDVRGSRLPVVIQTTKGISNDNITVRIT